VKLPVPVQSCFALTAVSSNILTTTRFVTATTPISTERSHLDAAAGTDQIEMKVGLPQVLANTVCAQETIEKVTPRQKDARFALTNQSYDRLT
jgi:hypothetical protein